LKAIRKKPRPDCRHQYISDVNRINILRLIRRHSKISRPELSEQSGLSSPSVSRVVQILIEGGLVKEAGTGESRGGKKPKLLEFAGADNIIIGIDLGASEIHGVLSNLNAEIIEEIKEPTPQPAGFDAVMRTIDRMIDSLLNHPDCRRDRIMGIGMAVEGLINRSLNIVEYAPAFNWTNVDIRGPVTRHTGLPVIFDNTARAMAIGELWYGVGQRHDHFICVHAGSGIGAGIITDGNPLYGTTGKAGEFGHFYFNPDSQIRCRYGNAGCLEALSSSNAIIHAVQRRLKSGTGSLLARNSVENPSDITLKMVIDAAKKGDSLAWNVFDHAAEYLGIGIAGLINLFNPDAIVIGGDLARAGDILFDRLKKTINARALKIIARDVPILPATFKERAVVTGSVALILGEILEFHDLECPCRESEAATREPVQPGRNGYVR